MYVLVESAIVERDGQEQTAQKVFIVIFPKILNTKSKRQAFVHINKVDVNV